MQAAEDYPVRLAVSDALGNAGSATAVIPVDVLVIREGDKLKIRISSITFAADTADYLKVDADKLEKNLRALKRLAEIFEKYKAYDIRIEGHAVNLSWANPAAAEREEKEELAPLSLARAQAVKDALVELGMDPRRISVDGLEGARRLYRTATSTTGGRTGASSSSSYGPRAPSGSGTPG